MWDRRGGSITRVADTLVISVSQPSEAAVWGDGPAAAAADCVAEMECRTPECRSPAAVAGLGVSSDGSPLASGTWLGGDSDTVEGLNSEEPTAAATGGDEIQIICRFDSPPRPPSPPSSPPPYPPPPPPTESPPTLAALSRDVSEFSSIIEIDGDSFCIRSRLAGREEPETPPENPTSSAAHRNSERGGEHDSDSDDSDGSDSEDEVTALVAECRRFYESRLPPRWPAAPEDPTDADETTSTREDSGEDTGEEEERPTSVDSGRESGTDSRTADSEEGDGRQAEPPAVQAQIHGQIHSQIHSQTQAQAQAQSPLEEKMALLRREVSSLMLQDNELFRQLFSLHDSIEALKHGEGSLSGGSSMSSLADIEEEDTISNPSTDLDRQSHLSSETDNFSLVKGGDTCSERSFFSEILHVTGMSHWAKTRMTGPDSLTPEQMAPPSPRQAAPPPQSPAEEKVASRSRHRKQGSCDSGIVDQEIRGQA